MRLSVNNEQGWTLVELMVVVTIMGIMFYFSYLGYGFIHREKINATSRQLLSDIQKMRIDALTSSPSSTLVLGSGIRFSSGAGGSYTTFAWYDNDGAPAFNPDFAYQVGEEWPGSTNTVQLPSAITLTLSQPGFPVLVYNRFGYPTLYALDSSGTSTTQPLDILITDPSTNSTRCIEVSENSIREGVVSGTTCTQLQ